MNHPEQRTFQNAGNLRPIYKVIGTGSSVTITRKGTPDLHGSLPTEMVGAVLAGLTLSETFFHLRDPMHRTSILHVKVRV